MLSWHNVGNIQCLWILNMVIQFAPTVWQHTLYCDYTVIQFTSNVRHHMLYMTIQPSSLHLPCGIIKLCGRCGNL